MHTLGGRQRQSRSRQKVYTLGSPRFALFHMHTRLSRFCGRLRKSAYTSRTPQRQPQQAKSAYTRQPRVLYKKYAYKADTIQQKVHTLAGHPPEILRAKSVHTRLPPGFTRCLRNAAGKKYAYKAAPKLPALPQTPPPHSGRRNLAERLSRGCWPASPFFLPFFALSFWFCRPRSGRLHPPAAGFAPVYVHTFLMLSARPRGQTLPARTARLLYVFFSVFVVHLFFALSFVFSFVY